MCINIHSSKSMTRPASPTQRCRSGGEKDGKQWRTFKLPAPERISLLKMRKILQIGLSHGSELTIRLPEPMSAVTTNGVNLTCPAYKAREAERREELALEEEKRQQEAADKKFAQERTTEALLAAGREDLLKLQTKERMQAYLKGKNMAISGKKEDLISRITKALHAPIPPPPPPPPQPHPRMEATAATWT